MDNFLSALCDGDISALATGPAPLEEIQAAWIDILEEYHEIKDNDPAPEWKLNRDIIRLQNHLTILEICLGFLEVRFSEKIAAAVRKLGYPFKPASTDPNDYRNLLQVVINKSKTKYVMLQQLLKQYDERNAEIKETKPPSRDYFDALLAEIEEMQRTTYDFDTLTVAKFTVMEKKYWKQVDFLKEKTKK